MLEKVAVVASNEQKEEILHLFEETDWGSFSSEDLKEIVDKFLEFVNSTVAPREMLKIRQFSGNQVLISNDRNFFIGKDATREIAQGVFDVLSQHLGTEPTKDLIVECMRSAIAKF